MTRSGLRLTLGILAIVVLAAAAAGAFAWWKISGLKEVLVRDLGNALGAQVQVTSLDLDLWKGELHAAGISLVNQRPSSPWEKGEISQATVRFHLSDILDSSLPVTVEVASWSLTMHPYTATSTAGSTEPNSTPAPSPSKSSLRVTKLSAHEGSVDIDLSADRKVLVRGVAFDADNNSAGVWTTTLQAASIVAGSLEAGASSVQIHGEQDKVAFSDLRMACNQGTITGDGEVALGGIHEARVNLKAAEIPVTMLVAVAWQVKLSGVASGNLHYEGDDQGGGAKGHISVAQGKFNLLPWLGKVTVLVGLQDISNVEIDKATSDYEWKDGTIHLINLDVRKNDVTRIAGEATIDPTGQIDAKLKLGLPSAVTAKWPQLQDKIFSVQQEDYNWTDVHLTGTPDHLQEDLTPRLLAFGEGQGSDLLQQTSQKAMDLFKSFMGN